MTAAVLQTLRTPQTGQDFVTITLVTRTPLYTGGIGQWGEQLHPSGLLGSIRFFSCLVARTLGESGFEAAVWGNAGENGQKARAKAVALHWDTAELKTIALPPRLLFKREDNQRDRGWYYNQAQEGALKLTLSRRGISDNHWNLLLLALHIQIRHATLGAKDQFGLGVLSAESLPSVMPLDENRAYAPVGFSLQRCAFGRLRLQRAINNRDGLSREQSLRLGLTARIALRDALRTAADAGATEQENWKNIRHRMMGALNQHGSAVNISAAYSLEDEKFAEIRLFVQLRLDDSTQRTEIMRRFSQALTSLPLEGWNPQKPLWEFGGSYGGLQHPAKWLNKLAGLQAA
ncbi:MAG: hypothetical protein PHE55_10240 [Methylococcaceae bacterium]|nr:hypothetical protein [Methylococcaceae bacterium]